MTIPALVIGANLYILNQFRVLTETGAELTTHHFSAVEIAKQVISSLYGLLTSDKQYFVLRDTIILKDFCHYLGCDDGLTKLIDRPD